MKKLIKHHKYHPPTAPSTIPSAILLGSTFLFTAASVATCATVPTTAYPI